MSNGIINFDKLPDGLKPAERPDRPTVSHTGAKPDFTKVLDNLIHDVDSLHKTAAAATEKLVTGKLEDVHQVVVAMEEAHISFRLMMEIRNKMVEAYREVMRTQV